MTFCVVHYLLASMQYNSKASISELELIKEDSVNKQKISQRLAIAILTRNIVKLTSHCMKCKLFMKKNC